MLAILICAVGSSVQLCVGCIKSGVQYCKDEEVARDKKCLEGQTFRCKPCHVPNFDSRNAAIPVLRPCQALP
jgi:hypothetical protein